MNVKRFIGRTSRDAMNLVRQAFGGDAVIASTRPCAEGIEILAMAPETVAAIERMGAGTEPKAAAAKPAAQPAVAAEVDQDVEQLAMSTLSFQDYVRERMLKRRQATLQGQAQAEPACDAEPDGISMARRDAPVARPASAAASRSPKPADVSPDDGAAERLAMMNELRSMKGLIEDRFGALAFMDKLQRSPGQARLTQKLLDCGFSPVLIRKLAASIPGDMANELEWAASVLERNLATGEAEAALEDQGGVYAMIGATGVGKTTSSAKLAAACAAKHGAANLGLITLDAYRLGAHEQLRAYGRILGVPVHMAHDRAALEDLLDLLSGKKMVIIDTAGLAQRDSRTRELLDMLSHRSIHKLLVINAAAQGETIEDVMVSYRAPTCKGVVLSKIDEAVKLGPALDALIRHRLRVVAVANGQRVPEDWHRLSSQALVHRALRSSASPAYRLDADDVKLVFAAPQAASRAAL